jgi:hypothetical protein
MPSAKHLQYYDLIALTLKKHPIDSGRSKKNPARQEKVPSCRTPLENRIVVMAFKPGRNTLFLSFPSPRVSQIWQSNTHGSYFGMFLEELSF